MLELGKFRIEKLNQTTVLNIHECLIRKIFKYNSNSMNKIKHKRSLWYFWKSMDRNLADTEQALFYSDYFNILKIREEHR